jgi:tRNA dimethylallyltransferase
MLNKTLYAIMGPTASGKTKLAIEYAQKLQTEIVSIDSRQVYKELNIGVARPSNEELNTVPHHLIASHSIHEDLDAAVYTKIAENIINELFSKYDNVVAVGGSTLYFKALLDGLDEIPKIEKNIRDYVVSKTENLDLVQIQKIVKSIDSMWYANNDVQNKARLIRVIEVYESTGNPMSFYQTHKKKETNYIVKKIGINLNREELYNRINKRCHEMLKKGLLMEVNSLIDYKNLNALRTVGYKEFFDYLQGEHSLENAVNLFKQHTRNYAKRQLTWFKKVEDINWIT